MRKGLETFCRQTILILAVVCTMTVLLLNVFFHSEVSYDVWEIVSISLKIGMGLSSLLAAFVLMMLFSHFFHRLEKIKPSILFAVLTGVYAVVGLYLICNQNNILRSDASFVYKAAIDMKRGVFTEMLPEGYIGIHPHQMGLMAYDWLLTQIAESPVLNFAVNWLMVIGINWLCWKIAKEMNPGRLIQQWTILISFGFFPQLFFILFAYGEIPGLFFLLLCFYHTLRICSVNSWKNWIGMLVGITLAVIVRNNNLIGAIACILYLLLSFLRNPKVRYLAAVAMVAVCMLLPNQLVRSGIEKAEGFKIDGGIPFVTWIAMGTDIDNRTSGPGWYDFSPDRIYRNAGYNRQAAAEIGTEKLHANLQKILQEPKRAALFFRDKMISVWCEPLFEAIWSGPMQVYGQTTYTPLLLSVYGGGKAEDLLEYMAEVMLMVIWIGCAAFLFSAAKQTTGWEVFFLYLIGGMLFHLIWEAKSQYIYPYVVCLIPFAACGTEKIFVSMQNWRSKQFQRRKRHLDSLSSKCDL